MSNNSLPSHETERKESSEWLLESPSRPLSTECHRYHLSRKALWTLTVFNFLLLGTSVLVSIRPILEMNYFLKKTSSYSPVLSKVDLSIDTSRIPNSTLLGTPEAESIYTKAPSPLVDAAWDVASAEGYELITISRAEVIRLGFDPDVIVKAPLDWDEGPDAYPVQIHVFHQLHCLDELRKQIYYDVYYEPMYGPPSQAPPLHFAHKKHCIHILQRALMCQTNVDVLPHYWREGATRPRADFNPDSKCRNFESLVDWNRKHAVRDINKKWASIKKPTDAVVLPAPTPRLYR